MNAITCAMRLPPRAPQRCRIHQIENAADRPDSGACQCRRKPSALTLRHSAQAPFPFATLGPRRTAAMKRRTGLSYRITGGRSGNVTVPPILPGYNVCKPPAEKSGLQDNSRGRQWKERRDDGSCVTKKISLPWKETGAILIPYSCASSCVSHWSACTCFCVGCSSSKFPSAQHRER